ncbi:E3 ubiquitin-protein ligase TRIM58-like isoform X1 [Sphaeramia orbicularis]|uniref:E3 ubiquitin-protein ligase TRIM58-like isoform X1 n=1 Tax=Sphaeramia orbicularis TaxID=375764 RepID=UPI00117ECAA1|nr:E3 ubiquitin-protein ligase TRIM58-like isoform X1 [Sphaeramia orbicularis]
MESVQRSLNQFKEKIQEKQRTTEKQAEDVIKELEQEICELEKRSTEVEQLSGSEDQLHLVQTSTSVESAPPMKTWGKVSVRPPAYEDTVVEAVTQLEDELRKVMMSVKGEIRRVQRFEVDVTLDPDTAHPRLVLSDDGKQVHDGGCWRKLPDNPQRFSHSPSVLGKQSFSSGRFYFEVQVKGVTHWTLGVVKESINRKQRVTLRPESSNWTMGLRNGDHYYGYGSPPVCLQLKSSPQKVGVFVDYEEGLVSFYDVDTAELTYSMTGCCFEEKLRPYFSLSGMTVLL